MKAFLLLLALLVAASARAESVLSRLDCQAGNGVSISTIESLNASVMVEAKWFGMATKLFEAKLEGSSIKLLSQRDNYIIDVKINRERSTAQNLTGSLLTDSKYFLALIYCTIELENI